MENQGFEGEIQPRTREASASFRRDSQQPFTFDRSGPQVFSSTADAHVYEDILPGVEDVQKRASAPSARDLAESIEIAARQPGRHLIECVSGEDRARSLGREEIAAGGFRRNLTLPFRRATGLDPSIASSSVRLTDRKRGYEEDAQAASRQSAVIRVECRPNRRRRKKDCKHCSRSKAAASANTQENEVEDREADAAVLRKNRDNEHQQRLHAANSNVPQTILDPRAFAMIPTCSPVGKADQVPGMASNPSSVFTISENIGNSPTSSVKLIESGSNESRANLVDSTEANKDDALIASEKSRPGLRVNSIYSQDRWYAKEAPIFFTDVKEESGSFQRAYSLPMRTQTPSSQNRINHRRSVRGEPPPHPATLHKHRRGWTMHLAHPLEASGHTRSLLLLLLALLVLLGIGGAALYIALVPEKLQIIQQYLRTSTNDSSTDGQVVAAGTFSRPPSDQPANHASTPASTAAAPSSTLAPSMSILLNGDRSFPESATPPVSEAETEASSPSSLNSTRYCDDCLPEEVCVALVDEEVPTCKTALDPLDPTGCAGFCLINKQKCHRLDVDAFRCVDVEHYCLDDEWTCLNALCIPLDKHCDGHMNCYDHSDEYNCVCDMETHFQCGNETSCLPLEKRCDGKIDCWDAADEINCTLGRNPGGSCPSENEFTCSNGQCIPKARFCDGLPDCLDESDEPHGCQGRCNKHEFTCQNSRCIAKGMKCNGIDDCGDGTDERYCKDRFS